MNSGPFIPPAFPNGPEVIYSNYSFTHETRITTTESIFGFDAVGGVFYSRLRGSWHFLYSPPDYNQLVTGNDPTNPIYAPDNNLFYGDQRTFQNETAEFGEVTYHVTKSLSVTAGLRHYVVTNGGDTLNTGILSTPSLDIVHSSTSGFAHKGNVSYQLTDNHLVYFQYSEGYRPGRGNLPPPPQCGDVSVPSQIQPDAIKEFELGTKTAWFDKRLTVNAAVYRIDWKNIQQSGFIPACGFGYADNFGAARIKGVELEVNDRLTSHVSAGFSGSFTQGRLQQDLPVVQGIPNAIRGDQVLGVPIWQYAAFGKATYPILQGDDGYTRLDWQYTGSSWANYNRLADGSRDPLSQLQVTRLLNLRTGMTYRSCDFSLSATNLLNMIARQSIDANGSVTTQIPGRPRYVVNRPRTFLIDAVYKF